MSNPHRYSISNKCIYLDLQGYFDGNLIGVQQGEIIEGESTTLVAQPSHLVMEKHGWKLDADVELVRSTNDLRQRQRCAKGMKHQIKDIECGQDEDNVAEEEFVNKSLMLPANEVKCVN